MTEDTYVSKLQKTKGSVVRPSTEIALAKLGKDIEFARRVRGISAERFAKSAGISRSTLHRLESGKGAGVSLNTLAMVLTILGKLDLLSNLIDMRNDDIGLSILRENVIRGTSLPHKTLKIKYNESAKDVNKKVGKRAPGMIPIKKSSQSGVEIKRMNDQKTLVVSPSGHASSLLSRLKATRDSSSS
ncbi:helix-turn-helix domain-containing protein [Proteus hauseri]|uniref:helix-turn-helix domain-containing protein n=1 Tax=Proteus hauseri TaxID=183417 RepID=UPI0032DBD013